MPLPSEMEKENGGAEAEATPAEAIAVLVIKSGRTFLSVEQGNLDKFVADSINIGGAGKKNIIHVPLGIDGAGQPIVGAPDQWQAVLDGAEDSISGVLPLRGAFP